MTAVRAVVQEVYGGPEVLSLAEDVEKPAVTGEKDVLVRVRAGGHGPERLAPHDRARRRRPA